MRVAWLPEEHAGRRVARVADLLPGHDPYHPSERQQQRILARQPGRAVVLVGEPATVGSLRQRWAETTDGDDFAAYVARRATLALDRAEYRLRGPRYKTPSLVKDEILSSRRFRSGLAAVRRGADGLLVFRLRWTRPGRSSTNSPRAGAAGSSTSCRPSAG